MDVGLSGGLTWSHTRRDGWAESEGGLMAGEVAAQTREMLAARIGIDAATTADLGGFAVTGFGSLRYTELLRDSADGGVVTLASGQDFGAFGFEDPIGLEVELGAATRLSETLEITASYRADVTEGDLGEGLLSAAIVGRF